MEIDQRHFRKGRRNVVLTKEDSLSVSICQGSTVNEFSVPLEVLDSNPCRIKNSGGKRWIAMALFCLGLSLCAFVEAIITADRSQRGTSLVSGVLILFPALIFGAQMWRDRYDLLIFSNRFSGQPVFNLFYGQPHQDEFAAFVAELTTRIQRCHAQTASVPAELSIPDQLQSFARLQEQGVLSAEEFAGIKSKLIASVNGKERIGF
jgi:hypothetical protein